MIEGMGGGIWNVVMGDWDRHSLEGDEINMVIDNIVVHPNFTRYQNDMGNTFGTKYPVAKHIK